MSYDSDALAGFDQWFGDILAGLSPTQRRKAARQLGQALRRSNLKRIAANVQPDGTAMEPRKPRKDARGRLKERQGGKMFRRLRYARHWKIDARQDSVEILPKGKANLLAVHHFGLTDKVGTDGERRPIRHRYPVRKLLGFSGEDEQMALEVAASLIDRGK